MTILNETAFSAVNLSSRNCSTPLPGFAVLIEKIASAPAEHDEIQKVMARWKLEHDTTLTLNNYQVLFYQLCPAFLGWKLP